MVANIRYKVTHGYLNLTPALLKGQFLESLKTFEHLILKRKQLRIVMAFEVSYEPCGEYRVFSGKKFADNF